jgi:hypothetical protein
MKMLPIEFQMSGPEKAAQTKTSICFTVKSTPDDDAE